MAERPSKSRYMSDRVDVRGIGAGAAVLLAAIVIGALASWVLVRLGNEGAAAYQAARPGRTPASASSIQLQTNPAAEMAAFRSEKQQLLESYGWVDREHGIARIPIERAMAILARQGGSGEPRVSARTP